MENQSAFTVAPPMAAGAPRPTDPAAPPRRRILRGIGAVGAGFLTIVVLSLGTDVALHAAGVFPPWGQTMGDGLFALATAYRILFSIVGCWVAARLAPDRPLRHALWLGGVGIVVSGAGAVAAATQGPALGPLWYPLALVAVTFPCAWAGGTLGGRPRPARG